MAEIKEMSMWEYMASVDGYAKVHFPEKAGALSEKDKDDLWEMVQARG